MLWVSGVWMWCVVDVQYSGNEETKWAVLITVYRPDPARWINLKRRK